MFDCDKKLPVECADKEKHKLEGGVNVMSRLWAVVERESVLKVEDP